jgi:DNA replication initiation complex subunit (GINS family)
MKHLYQELNDFKIDLDYAFENEEFKQELDEITENDYFEEILEVCEEIVQLKKIMIDFGYEL